MPYTLYKRNKIWWIVFSHHGERHRLSLKTTSKGEAQLLAEKGYSDFLKLRAGISLDVTLRKAVDQFMVYSRVNKKSHIGDHTKTGAKFI